MLLVCDNGTTYCQLASQSGPLLIFFSPLLSKLFVITSFLCHYGQSTCGPCLFSKLYHFNFLMAALSLSLLVFFLLYLYPPSFHNIVHPDFVQCCVAFVPIAVNSNLVVFYSFLCGWYNEQWHYLILFLIFGSQTVFVIRTDLCFVLIRALSKTNKQFRIWICWGYQKLQWAIICTKRNNIKLFVKIPILILSWWIMLLGFHNNKEYSSLLGFPIPILRHFREITKCSFFLIPYHIHTHIHSSVIVSEGEIPLSGEKK